jgi:hypothetical protein
VNSFISMPDERRKTVCDQAAAQSGLLASSVEKDFWVSWTLRELFRLPEWGGHLTFKGGTSLSKGWKLIERFSEDIDIVIGRDALGFDGDKAPGSTTGINERRRRMDALKAACQKCVNEDIQSMLRAVIEKAIPGGLEWTLEPDPKDNDNQTLLFKYPTVYPDPNADAYLQRRVKIEMGARSDTDPSEEIQIQPLIAEAFPDISPDSTFPVHAVSPVRTFWEKAMLLHEETYRPLPKEPGEKGRPKQKKGPKQGMSRHYYDLFRLIKTGVAAKAISDLELFGIIVAHREVYFRWSWVDYGTLKPGTLRLIPPDHYLSDWRNDYNDMQEEMFYGDGVPDFDEVLLRVEHFQNQFNEQGAT